MGRNKWNTYPECPACKAIGKKGLTITKLEGKLHCLNCNSMFEYELDKNYNIKIGKSLGD